MMGTLLDTPHRWRALWGIPVTRHHPVADTHVGQCPTDAAPRRPYVVRVTIPTLRAARFLTVAGGLGLAVAGMLTLSLPLMLAGAVLWLLGIVLEERAAGR